MSKIIKNRLKTVIISSIVVDIMLIIFGLFLICNPLIVTEVVNLLLGISIMISGIYSVIKYLLNNKKNPIFSIVLGYGLIAIIFGGILLFKPLLLANLITIIVGVWAIMSGIIKIIVSLRFKYHNEESWLINMVIAILTVCTGILLIINPFNGTVALSVYIGLTIIVNSGLDIVEKLIFNKRINEISKIIYF